MHRSIASAWISEVINDPTIFGRYPLEEEPPGRRYLVVSTSRSPRIRRITETIAERLRQIGHVAELGHVTLRRCGPPHLADYDAAIVTLSVGRHLDRAIVRWLGYCRPTLAETPTALFLVGPRWSVDRALRHVRELDWRPALIAVAPGSAGSWRAGLEHLSGDRDDATHLAAQFDALVEELHAARTCAVGAPASKA